MPDQKSDIFKELASRYIENIISTKMVDVVTFAEASWGLNMKLFPVQRLVLKAYYGLELNNLDKTITVRDEVNEHILFEFTEAECMDYLISEQRTNLKKYVPGKEFLEMVLCCGRRASKSMLAAIVANYEAYKLLKLGDPAKYYGFPSGQEIRITEVAVSDDDSMTLFDMTFIRAMNCDYIKDRMSNTTMNYCVMQTDYDINMFGKGKNKRASIRMVSGNSSSSSIRGKNNIVTIFDESAFFIDNNGRFSGQEVYSALTPSVASFTNPYTKRCDGKVLTLSSPYSKSGIFWDLYNMAFREPENMLMFKMYTALMNPTVASDFLKTEKRKNPQSFKREYGAEFSDNIASWLDEYDVKKMEENMDTERKNNLRNGKHGVEYFWGIDIGQKNDGVALAIVHKENNTVCLDYADVFYGAQSDVWEYRDTLYKECKEFAGYDVVPLEGIAEKFRFLTDWYPPRSGFFDQWSGYAFMEILKQKKVVAFRMENISEGLNMQIYSMVKSLMTDGMIKMFNHSVLVPELKLLEIERHGGKFKVHAPTRPGFHDDISVAFTRAVYECYNYYKERVDYNSLSFNNKGIETAAKGVGDYHTYLKRKMQQHGGISEKRSTGRMQNRRG